VDGRRPVSSRTSFRGRPHAPPGGASASGSTTTTCPRAHPPPRTSIAISSGRCSGSGGAGAQATSSCRLRGAGGSLVADNPSLPPIRRLAASARDDAGVRAVVVAPQISPASRWGPSIPTTARCSLEAPLTGSTRLSMFRRFGGDPSVFLPPGPRREVCLPVQPRGRFTFPPPPRARPRRGTVLSSRVPAARSFAVGLRARVRVGEERPRLPPGARSPTDEPAVASALAAGAAPVEGPTVSGHPAVASASVPEDGGRPRWDGSARSGAARRGPLGDTRHGRPPTRSPRARRSSLAATPSPDHARPAGWTTSSPLTTSATAMAHTPDWRRSAPPGGSPLRAPDLTGISAASRRSQGLAARCAARA
jgi:hypothetical protein